MACQYKYKKGYGKDITNVQKQQVLVREPQYRSYVSNAANHEKIGPGGGGGGTPYLRAVAQCNAQQSAKIRPWILPHSTLSRYMQSHMLME